MGATSSSNSRGWRVSLGLPRSREEMVEVANKSLRRGEGGDRGRINKETTCGHKSN